MLNTFQQARHPMLPHLTHDEATRQEFTKAFKGFIQGKLLPGPPASALPADADPAGLPRRGRCASAVTGGRAAAADDVADAVVGDGLVARVDRRQPGRAGRPAILADDDERRTFEIGQILRAA